MHCFASSQGDPGDFDTKIWGDMYYMDMYYSFAKESAISWEEIDSIFYSFLNDGTSIHEAQIFQSNSKHMKPLLTRIMNYLQDKIIKHFASY